MKNETKIKTEIAEMTSGMQQLLKSTLEKESAVVDIATPEALVKQETIEVKQELAVVKQEPIEVKQEQANGRERDEETRIFETVLHVIPPSSDTNLTALATEIMDGRMDGLFWCGHNIHIDEEETHMLIITCYMDGRVNLEMLCSKIKNDHNNDVKCVIPAEYYDNLERP